MGKAKPAHHTAKELAMKAKNATINRGGGTGGIADRAGGKAGHAKYECPVCGQAVPDPKTAEAHWDSKHGKMGAIVIDAWRDKHEDAGGVTTQGINVQGSKKVKHK
jgi:hypothetical protein